MSREAELLWSGPAIQDLVDLADYISQDNPSAAESLVNRIKVKLLRLRRFPLSGKPVAQFSEQGYREVIVYPYRIVYAIGDQGVVILRVWHGKRDLKKIDDEDDQPE